MMASNGSPRLRAQGGFSLLEAIVALTILATVGMALFAAMSQSTQMVARAEHARRVDSAVRNAAAWMQSVNPANTPRGEQQLGDVHLRWSSEPIEPVRDAMTGYLQSGLYEVGLYRVRLELEQDGQPLADVDIRRAGYRQVREPAQL